MTDMVFDSSSIISLALNNLMGALAELKKHFRGDFIIPQSVKEEIIDTPLKSKKYGLEALMLSSFIGNVFKLFKNLDTEKKATYLMNLANGIFIGYGNPIKIVDKAEMESLAIAVMIKASYAVDERTARLLVENPINLKKILEKKFRTRITLNKNNLNKFVKNTKGVDVIRSSELMTIAYEKGLFETYKNKNIPKALREGKAFKRELLNGLLWGLKLRGCAISRQEIQDILHIEGI